ncbi:acetyl-CoA carboxylase carboxyltransferase subunit beta [Weissella cibaria]|uniref:acetyl-CoA carboxylase carboxyltransferase subunit beta n=1 Tax=Weissella cibaria TaxID=137591 RepID=UPI00123BE81D|nr:acetyl-CoA carboxylase carboxyltransferase subunit beta [Weissella cibaria]
MTQLFENNPDNFKHTAPADARTRGQKGDWVTCAFCGAQQYKEELGEFLVCGVCGYGFRLGAAQRANMMTDSFTEWHADIEMTTPDFPGYAEKLTRAQAATGLKEAVLTGEAVIEHQRTALAIMDAGFMMGSLGAKTGAKLVALFDDATANDLPVILFSASGGARMQEGIRSLMQLANVSAAIARHREAGLVYIVVLTDPTMGGVTASFAMQGDIILSEPHALVGFAGRRVIEQTIHETLPKDFQRAEHMQASGFIDAIVARPELQHYLGQLLRVHQAPKEDAHV